MAKVTSSDMANASHRGLKFQRIAANRDVEAIKLNTLLGNCKLEISAQLRNDKIKEAAQLGLKYLVWHEIPADAYKKGSDFKRDSEYSDALAAHMVAACKSGLGEIFENIEISTAKVIKLSPLAKLIKEFVSLGMDEKSAREMAEKVLEAAKPKQPEEVSVEA